LVTGGKVSGRGLFGDFQTFLLINNHPRALLQQTEQREVREEREELNNFVANDTSDEESEEEDFNAENLDDDDKEVVETPDPKDEDELRALSSLKIRQYILSKAGGLHHMNHADPRDTMRRAIEIFRKEVDPENEYLEEEIKFLKRDVLKEFILRKGGTEEDICGKSKTDLRNFAAHLHRKLVLPPPDRVWYEQVMNPSNENTFDWDRAELSIKINALIEIINICHHLGDKLIVFSQSVISLDTIEGFLHDSTVTKGYDSDIDEPKMPMFVGDQKWYKNIDYFRIDGSVTAAKRTTFIESFNDLEDTRAR
jgi:SNF2 family DNA or RNA helicase